MKQGLKVDLGLAREDCQHAVTDESLCTVTGCALGTDVRQWMFKTKVNMVQGQEDGPLSFKRFVMKTDKAYIASSMIANKPEKSTF